MASAAGKTAGPGCEDEAWCVSSDSRACALAPAIQRGVLLGNVQTAGRGAGAGVGRDEAAYERRRLGGEPAEGVRAVVEQQVAHLVGGGVIELVRARPVEHRRELCASAECARSSSLVSAPRCACRRLLRHASKVRTRCQPRRELGGRRRVRSLSEFACPCPWRMPSRRSRSERARSSGRSQSSRHAVRAANRLRPAEALPPPWSASSVTRAVQHA